MRILLADDETRIRFALRTLLHQQPGLEVVAEAADADTLLERTGALCPDLVLLDWELPGLEPDAHLAALRRCCPILHLIALSGRPEAERQATEMGADAFVSKSYPPERLLAVIGRLQLVSRVEVASS